jgi:hypothetical protein
VTCLPLRGNYEWSKELEQLKDTGGLFLAFFFEVSDSHKEM